MRHIQNLDNRYKQIVVDLNNYLALKKLGQAGDSFNDVIKELIKMRSDGCSHQNKV